jgi:tricarballylate dehydrogenase
MADDRDGIDVLVVGDGLAGCVAAIAVREAGGRVLVIEKAPADVPHSNTAFSGGAFRRVSPDYSAESYQADVIRLSEGRADPELARILVEKSAEAQMWLESLGVVWMRDCYDTGETAQPVDRGLALAAALRRAVRARGIEIRYRTEATALLRAGERITGVRVRNADGRESDIGAGAVVLACGGFSASPEMVVRHIGEGARHLVRRGSPFNTGDGLRMAEAAGARLDWMDQFHGGLIHYGYKQFPEVGAVKGMRHIKGYETGILVNARGERFVDEGEDLSTKTYAKFGKIIPLTQPGGFAWVIFDAATHDEVEPLYDGPESDPAEAATIAELAAKTGLPADALQRTVEDFNAGVADGRNLSARPPKSQFAQRIDHPPFYAHKLTGGFTFTFGGLRAKPTGEVLDTKGAVIPGLFAVGEITTGLFYGNYGAGSSLPKCVIFGRMGGVAACEYAARGRAAAGSVR